jgi:hypothetical protein
VAAKVVTVAMSLMAEQSYQRVRIAPLSGDTSPTFKPQNSGYTQISIPYSNVSPSNPIVEHTNGTNASSIQSSSVVHSLIYAVAIPTRAAIANLILF